MKEFSTKLKLWAKLKSKSIGHLFTPEPQPEKWVFIVGCYNSGTTLLHNLLASHPLIGSMPNEGQFYSNQLPRGADFDLPRLWALKPELFYLSENTPTSIDAKKLRKEWGYFYNHPKRKILIEKTILNTARTKWLQKNFPNAYFISLFRNGYAVSEGIFRKEKHSIEKSATQWGTSNEILLDDSPSLKNHLQLKYEDLVANPAATMKKVTDFLSVDELEEAVFKKNFQIHKVNAVIKDMNQESIARLNKVQIESINHITGKVLERLNYPLL
ncbi:MAG: sulfotransferase [Bacteroidetes bacterium]|nr:sulfotransferase [Bacteroidota bacterium]